MPCPTDEPAVCPEPDPQCPAMGTLAERLSRAMDARRLTVADLVRATGLTKAGIGFIKNGTTQADTVRATTIDKLAAALGVSRNWLLYGRGGMELGSAAPETGPAAQASGLDAGRLRDARLVLEFLDDFLPTPAGLWKIEAAVKLVYDYLEDHPELHVTDATLVDTARQVVAPIRTSLEDESTRPE